MRAREFILKESVGSKLKDLASIATNMPNADFWLIRKGSDKTVGKPVKEFEPQRIGVKVVRTDILDPNYLYYMMMNLHNKGYFASIANGTTNLVNIKVSDVANVPIGSQDDLEEGNDLEFHTGGGYGLPFPGTYEEEYNKFKTKGQRRITVNFESVDDTITLNTLYDEGYPDENEMIWNFVGLKDFNIPFKIKTITLDELKTKKELYSPMNADNKKVVELYKKSKNLSNEIIVMSDGMIIDGHHRAKAALLTKQPIKYIDISDQNFIYAN
jgi:hypothetical protein